MPKESTEWKLKYGGILASFYDADHAWRDYQKQAEFVASLGLPKNAEILDMCCGSGNHAIPLAQKNFNVLGIDLSMDLLKQARGKVRNSDLPARFHKCDIFAMGDQMRYCSRFDAVILLGWTLCIESIYQRIDELFAVIGNILKPSGLFVFDCSSQFAPLPQKPLEYQADGMKGLLNIKQKIDPQNKTSTYVYDWKITPEQTKALKKHLTMQVKETLRHVHLEDIRAHLDKFKQFQTLGFYGDYNRNVPYQKAHKNVIGVVKNVFGY